MVQEDGCVMDIQGIKIRSNCCDVRLLAKREQNQEDRPTSVSHNFYDKWARKQNREIESDSDCGVPIIGSIISPRYSGNQTAIRKMTFSAIPPEKYLRPKYKNRRIIYRPESCQFSTDTEHVHQNMRKSQTSMGFQTMPKLPTINNFRDGRHRIMMEDVNNYRRRRNTSRFEEPKPLPMNNAVLSFTKDIVLRGDKYMFIDQIYKKIHLKQTPKYSLVFKQSVVDEEISEKADGPIARAQLIDFAEIKQILSLRRERLEKERLETLRKSDYTTFSIPVRPTIKITKI